MNEKIQFYVARDMGQVLNATVRFIRENFKPLMRVFFTVAFPLYILGATFSTMGAVRSIASAAENPYGMANTSFLGSLTLFAIIGGILSFIAYMLLSCSAVYSLEHYRETGEVPTPSEVFKRISDHGWQLLLAYLGLGLLFAGAAFVFSLIFGGMAAVSGVLGVILIIGGMLLGLYLLAPLMIFSPIYLVEKGGLSDSLTRAYELVKGRWWRTIGIVLVIMIISVVFTYIPTTILTLSSMNDITDLNSGGLVKFTIITNVITTLTMVFIGLFTMMSFTMHYYSLREEKENLSLKEAVDDFTSDEYQNPEPNN